MTKRFAVLGSPISHSKSPLIHNYIFEKTGFDASYERFEVTELEDFLGLHSEFEGFSLTMPLKEQAFVTARTLDQNARITEAVNTLSKGNLGWSGHNTDVQGIANAVGFTPSSVAVIGSGATARSALAAFPDSRKLIHARNQLAAAELAQKFECELVELEAALISDLVISTVPADVLPKMLDGKEASGTLLDCAYTNPELPAARYVSGLQMLVHQAIIQQRIFQNDSPSEPLKNEPELIAGVLSVLDMAK